MRYASPAETTRIANDAKGQTVRSRSARARQRTPGGWGGFRHDLLVAFAVGAALHTGGAAARGQCPSPGSCFAPHAGPGCADACCCQAVCAILSYCCEEGADWDAFCADLANSNTLPACSGSPPTPVVAFSGAPFSGNEGTVVTVTLAKGVCSSSAVSVAYATSNGTAVAGSDYVAASGTATWAAGDTTVRTFTVTILGDAVQEPGETVILTLSSVVGGTIGAPNPTTLTIFDLTQGVPNNLLVSSFNTSSVIEYSWPGGAALGALVPAGSGGLDGPRILRFGPNGNLLVPSFYTSSLIRYNGTSGALLGTFVASGSGGLLNPFGQAWAPDGNVLLSSQPSPFTADCVARFNGATGAPLGNFVCLPTNPCCGAINLAFRPNGNVLVSHLLQDQVREYTYPGAALVRTYSGGGLDGPEGVTIGPNGNLFVCSALNDRIIQFNAASGAVIGDFVAGGSGGLDIPIDLAFGPNGNLFVSSALTNSILQYNGSSGAFIGAFVPPGSGGLSGPSGIAFRPVLPDLAGDIDGDGDVDVADLVAVITGWGICPPGPCPADVNGDGMVNVVDLVIVVANWT